MFHLRAVFYAGGRPPFAHSRLHAAAALVVTVVAALALRGAAAHAVAAEPGKRPNIIFLMADDMGYGDLGCYNAKSKIPTPNMDALARQGMRFTDAHSPSAVCTPTRYGVLTGRFCWRTKLKRGVLRGYSPSLIDTRRLTVAKLLKSNGYQTACVGKWHLGLGDREKTDYGKPLTPGPNDLGFDYFFGIPASLDMEPYVYVKNNAVVEAPTETVEASKQVRQGGEGFWRGGPIAPSFKHIEVLPKITEQAVAFIDSHAKKASQKDSARQPFFLYFPLSAPHTPWLPTKEFRGKSGAGAYGDFTVQVDWTVGQVMKALERNGLAENTLLIVTSDNGAHWTPGDKKKFGHLANGPLRGQKADCWEGGHRVPFLARWPGKIKSGATSDQLMSHTDFLATVAAILDKNLPQDAGEDSFNMLPAFLGEKLDGPIRDSIVNHSAAGYFCIRRGPWKLILGRGSGGFSAPRSIKPKPGEPQGQLYNLDEDLAEETNLFDSRPEKVKELTELLERQQKSGRSRS